MVPSRELEPGAQGDRVGSLARRPLVWLNVLCLDAPLVAIAWQGLFAHAIHVDLAAADRVALFLSAWVIYLGDRWFASVASPGGASRSLRERFCLRHRRGWIVWSLVVLSLDWFVAWRFLERRTFVMGLLLAGVVVAYLVTNSTFSRLWATIPVKEVAVGVLFAAGTLLVFAPSPPSRSCGFGGAAALFACLCSLNCMSIAVWERPLDRALGRHSIATRWSGLTRPIVIGAIALVPACAALVLCDRDLGSLAACLGASLLLLAALHRGTTAALDERTALADLVLLTPCVVLVLESVA
jgi:hypothetical protein